MTSADDYKQARSLAVEIARSFAAPRFYADLRRDREISRRLLLTDPVLERSRQIVIARDERFGHGLRHSEKVATDAGAIVHEETERTGNSPAQTRRAMFLVQLASLLHDIRRRVPNHARQSAILAAEILEDFPVDEAERQWIVRSIENHEAFVEPAALESEVGQLLSDALYDADKFRWGPDNFTETLWEMVSSEIPIRALLAHFPKGMEGVRRIAGTFRSETGMKYGPEFIEIGIAIGERLYEELLERFPLDEE
ncbi:MAG: hypothetical protein Kow0099_14610 [Candidatus Abyssubacteria bacterium]